MSALSVPPRFDEATEKLLAGLTSLQPDLEALNHTLLVKLRYLTNGTVLSDGGASVMQQVKLFIKHQPELFRRSDAFSIIKGLLEAPKPSLGRKGSGQRDGHQVVESVYTLAARAFFALHQQSLRWPLDLLQYYTLDSLGPRHWVDFPELDMFVKNLLAWTLVADVTLTMSTCDTSANTEENAMDTNRGNPSDEIIEEEIIEEEEEVLEEGGIVMAASSEDLSGERGPAADIVFDRYAHCSAEARDLVLNALSRRIDADHSIICDTGMGNHSVISTLAAFSRIHQVRTMATACLPRLLGQISAAEEIKRLIFAIVKGLGNDAVRNSKLERNAISSAAYFDTSALRESDALIVGRLVKLRGELKPSQQEVYRTMLKGLAQCSAPIGRLVLKVMVEDDILISGTAANKADTIKLIVLVFKSAQSRGSGVKTAASAETEQEAVDTSSGKDSVACRLFALALHDILLTRLEHAMQSSVAASTVAMHGWDYVRDGALIDIIVKVLRLLDVTKVDLGLFFRTALIEPFVMARALAATGGHMPSVDRLTGTRQTVFIEELLVDLRCRKMVSDVLWVYSEVSKMLQVLLGHEVCAIDKILRDRDRLGSQEAAPGGGARINAGRGASGKLMSSSGPSFSTAGLSLKPGGRVGGGLSLGAGRGRGGGIPAGLTLNRSATARPKLSAARQGAVGGGAKGSSGFLDAPAESPRQRAGSIDLMDSIDGDGGLRDPVTPVSQIQTARQHLYMEILSIQEASLDWQYNILSQISTPSVLCCSLLPAGTNTGRLAAPAGAEAGAGAETGAASSGCVVQEPGAGWRAARDGVNNIPAGDSHCVFSTTAVGSVPVVTEVRDEHARLWIAWIKTCMCTNVTPHYRTSADIDRTAHLLLRDNGIVSTAVLSKILKIVEVLTLHSYNADVDRLSDGVETKGKSGVPPSSSQLFPNNRRRDLLTVLASLDVVDTVVLRGVRGGLAAANPSSKSGAEAAFIVRDNEIITSILNLSRLRIVEKEQKLLLETRNSPGSSILAPSSTGGRFTPALPPVQLKSLFWRCAVSCFVLGSACPSSLGLYIWNKVPAVKRLLLMAISSQFSARDGGVSGDGVIGKEQSDIIASKGDANGREMDSSSQNYLYKDYSSEGASILPSVPPALGRSIGPWRYSAANGVTLVVHRTRVSAGTSCSRLAFERAVSLLERHILASLFTEVSRPAADIAPPKKKKKIQEQTQANDHQGEIEHNANAGRAAMTEKIMVVAPDAKVCVVERSKEDTTSRKRCREDNVLSPNYAEREEGPAERAPEDSIAPALKRGRDVVSPPPLPPPVSVPPDLVTSPPTMPCDDSMEASQEISAAESESSIGLRRSSRVRTMRFSVTALMRSGGRSRGDGAYADISSDEEVKRPKRSKKRKRKGGKGVKLSSTKKGAKKKKGGKEIGSNDKKKRKEEASAEKKRKAAELRAFEERPKHNMVGKAYSTQFGSLLLDQPPFRSPDGLPSECEIMFASVDGIEREPPEDIEELIRALDNKYNFGETLRGCTDPDFISSAVLAGADTALENVDSDGCCQSRQEEYSSSQLTSPQSLREHIERSAGWLLSTISAEAKLLLRIPPVGCAYLYTIVCCRLVRRVYASGVWDGAVYSEADGLLKLLYCDSGYISEMRLLSILSCRMLQLLHDPSLRLLPESDGMSSSVTVAVASELTHQRSVASAIFKVICLEIGDANSDRRCGGRLAVMSLIGCSNYFLNSKGKIPALPIGEASNTARSLAETQLQHVVNLGTDAEGNGSAFPHILLQQGPSLPDSIAGLWRLSRELSARSDVSLASLVTGALAQLLEVENDESIIAACLHFLTPDEENGNKTLLNAEERDMNSLKSQAATEGLIGFLAKQPLAAMAILSAQEVDRIPAILTDLLDSMLEGVQVDGLARPSRGESKDIQFVSVAFPTGITSMEGSSWPDPTLGREVARYQIHSNLIKSFLTSMGIYIQCFHCENIPKGWRGIFIATIYILNTMTPQLLLTRFSNDLLRLGTSVLPNQEMLCSQLSGWMSLEVSLAFLMLSEEFDPTFLAVLVRRVVRLLYDSMEIGVTSSVDSEIAMQKKTRQNKKKMEETSSTDTHQASLLSAAIGRLGATDPATVSRLLISVCCAIDTGLMRDDQYILEFVLLLQHKYTGQASDLGAAEGLSCALSALQGSMAREDTIDDSNFDIEDAGADGLQTFLRGKNGTHQRMAQVLSYLKKTARTNFRKVVEIVCALFTSSDLCVGSKFLLVDILFVDRKNILISSVIDAFDSIMIQAMGNRDDSVGIVGYMYLNLVLLSEDAGDVANSKFLRDWLPGGFIKTISMTKPAEPKVVATQCTCRPPAVFIESKDAANTDGVYEKILLGVCKAVISDICIAGAFTAACWAAVATPQQMPPGAWVGQGSDTQLLRGRAAMAVLLAAYTAFPEEMLDVVTKAGDNKYSEFLYFTAINASWDSFYYSAMQKKHTEGSFTRIGCAYYKIFDLRGDFFMRNKQLFAVIAAKIMNSSLSLRLCFAVDALTSLYSVAVCSHSSSAAERKRFAFSEDRETAAKKVVLMVANRHPVIWNMFVPLFLAIIDRLGSGGESEPPYAFPLPTGADLPALLLAGTKTATSSGAAGLTIPSGGRMLALTTSPRRPASADSVALLDCLKEIVSRYKEISDVENLSSNGEIKFGLRADGKGGMYDMLATRIEDYFNNMKSTNEANKIEEGQPEYELYNSSVERVCSVEGEKATTVATSAVSNMLKLNGLSVVECADFLALLAPPVVV